MTLISLFGVGSGTFSSQECLQSSFALLKPGINAGTWASGKFHIPPDLVVIVQVIDIV